MCRRWNKLATVSTWKAFRDVLQNKYSIKKRVTSEATDFTGNPAVQEEYLQYIYCHEGS